MREKRYKGTMWEREGEIEGYMWERGGEIRGYMWMGEMKYKDKCGWGNEIQGYL